MLRGQYAPPQQGDELKAIRVENANLKAQLNANRQEQRQQIEELKTQLAALAAQMSQAKAK